MVQRLRQAAARGPQGSCPVSSRSNGLLCENCCQVVIPGSCAGKPPFKHLIYPMPEEGGLGAHLTLDLAGQAKFGPDVEWVDSIDYTVDPGRAEGFYHTIRRYWPSLPDGALQPSYSGAAGHLSARHWSSGKKLYGPSQRLSVHGLTQCDTVCIHLDC